MIGKLSLTEQLSDCQVGVPKEISILVTPTRNDPGLFEADVEELVGYEHEQPASEPASEPTSKRGAAPAVAIVIKGKGK